LSPTDTERKVMSLAPICWRPGLDGRCSLIRLVLTSIRRPSLF
jgi:hypothetical protein